MERVYTTKDVAARLQSGESTIRKWSIALQNAGYRFLMETRGEITSRMYIEHDIAALQEYKTLMQDKQATMESVAVTIVERFGEQERGQEYTRTLVVPPSVEAGSVQQELSELNERMDKQNQFNQMLMERQDKFNQTLMERLDEQQKYIENSITRRDEQLTEAMRKLLAPAKETGEEEKSRKRWWRFGR